MEIFRCFYNDFHEINIKLLFKTDYHVKQSQAKTIQPIALSRVLAQ